MLTATNITVSYSGRAAVRGVSLSVAGGKLVALLGPNGAGKTSLLKSLNGALELQSGRVEIDGRPLSAFSRREIAQRIAVVAQENETRFAVSVLDYVLGGRYAHGEAFGWETESDLRIAQECLRLCDLGGYENRFMNELSGGERQRVVLARAIATQAGILLLDEPTANLDLAHQAMMFRLVRDRCADCGASAIVITHDPNLAAEFVDEMVLMQEGAIVAHGTPEEVLTARNLKQVFGVEALLDRNPATGKTRVTTVFGARV